MQVVVSFALALDAAIGALRSRRTAPAKVTAEERLSEQRLVLVVPYALALVAAVGALRSRRTAPAKVTGKEGSASRDAQARVVAEAKLSAKTCALSENRGLSSLASESRPLIFCSARTRRGRG